jgi:hypothetical protein
VIAFGWKYLPPHDHRIWVGQVVATGPVRATSANQPIALIRIGADVVRFEGPSVAGCTVGDYADVQKTYTTRNGRRGSPTLIGTDLISRCRPLP